MVRYFYLLQSTDGALEHCAYKFPKDVIKFIEENEKTFIAKEKDCVHYNINEYINIDCVLYMRLSSRKYYVLHNKTVDKAIELIFVQEVNRKKEEDGV